MSKQIGYVIGIVLTLILGGILQYFICCKHSDTTMESNNDTSFRNPGVFSLKGEDLDYRSIGNFTFLKEDYDHLPISYDSINIGIELLKRHLETHPEKNLSITGYAISWEENKSLFPNLGFARANSTKNYFTSRGIAKERIYLDGKIADDLLDQNDTLVSGVSFFLFQTEEGAESTDYVQIKKEINENPIHLYFEVGEASIFIGDSDRVKMSKIIDYLDHVVDSELILIGHTDNTGDRADNFILGEARAEFLKSYLVRNGVQESKINTSSKGPDEPIADNSTEEGRSQNRRVTVKIN
jgi:outer membrane protein OmpA-like peptidoglycan-associated protein